MFVGTAVRDPLSGSLNRAQAAGRKPLQITRSALKIRLDPEIGIIGQPVFYKPKTYSTVAWRISLSSGNRILLRITPLGPDAIATYCVPLISYVIGGAVKPDPTLIFHNSSRVVSSYAATVPSNSARNTSPPPVESAPEKVG